MRMCLGRGARRREEEKGEGKERQRFTREMKSHLNAEQVEVEVAEEFSSFTPPPPQSPTQKSQENKKPLPPHPSPPLHLLTVLVSPFLYRRLPAQNFEFEKLGTEKHGGQDTHLHPESGYLEEVKALTRRMTAREKKRLHRKKAQTERVGLSLTDWAFTHTAAAPIARMWGERRRLKRKVKKQERAKKKKKRKKTRERLPSPVHPSVCSTTV
mmetsp:Transcript_54451/g.106536  ORF Transcript_54451/g.106536 Transcript_54451/m.106536 type:complete len:212 (+) Transcript_54451:450-1085(+)